MQYCECNEFECDPKASWKLLRVATKPLNQGNMEIWLCNLEIIPAECQMPNRFPILVSPFAVSVFCKCHGFVHFAFLIVFLQSFPAPTCMAFFFFFSLWPIYIKYKYVKPAFLGMLPKETVLLKTLFLPTYFQSIWSEVKPQWLSAVFPFTISPGTPSTALRN